MDKLFPGKIDNVNGSMIEAIENQMASLFFQVKGTNIPDMGKKDREILFAAIARGVLQYLKDNQDLIKINLNFQQDPTTFQITQISANVDFCIDMDKRSE
jgi:hypothetical protein